MTLSGSRDDPSATWVMLNVGLGSWLWKKAAAPKRSRITSDLIMVNLWLLASSLLIMNGHCILSRIYYAPAGCWPPEVA